MKECSTDDVGINANSVINEHHMIFLDTIANAAGCEPNNILDLDLYLYDHQKAVEFKHLMAFCLMLSKLFDDLTS